MSRTRWWATLLTLGLATALPAQWRGQLVARVSDPRAGAHAWDYALFADDGRLRTLRARDERVEATMQRLSGSRVQVDGTPDPDDAIRVDRVAPLADGLAPISDGVTTRASAGLPTGAFRVLTVLCRLDGDPAPTRDRAHFLRMTGDAFPGLGALFAQSSGGRLPLTGSRTTDWVVSSRPARDYYPTAKAFEIGSAFGGSTFARDTAMAGDCMRQARAADPTLDVRQFDALNLQVTTSLDASYANMGAVPLPAPGGGTVLLRFALEAGWAQTSVGTHAHELGHTLGLDHTLGARRDCTTFMTPGGLCPYDSRWTLMSAAAGASVDGIGFGSPFIAFERNRLGWFDAQQLRTVADRMTDTTVLRPLDGGPPGVRMIRLPLDGDRVLTLEYRRRAPAGTPSFDAALPATGVLLHETTPTRATVIDANANNDVNDPLSVLGTGGVWRDDARGIVVTALTVADTGAVVVVARRAPFVVRSPVAVRRTLVGARIVDTLLVQGAPGPVTVALESAPAFVQLVPGVAPVLRVIDPPAGTHLVRYRATAGSETTTGLYTLEVPETPTLFGRDTTLTWVLGAPIPAGWRGISQPSTQTDRGWRTQSGTGWSGIPPGLRLTTSIVTRGPDTFTDFSLAGTPTTLGRWTLTVTAGSSDSDPSLRMARSFVVRVVDRLFAVRDTIRPGYVVGRPIADTIVTVGGRRLTGWTPSFALLEGALPRGTTLGANGVVTGVPADTGAWAARVRVTLPEDTTIVMLRGRAGRAITIAARPWRDTLEVRQVIADTLRVESLAGAPVWRLLDGTLPAGITLTPDGRLIGTVTAAGAPSARLEARTTAGDADTTVLAPRVLRRALVATLVADTTTRVEGDSLRLTIRLTGGDAATPLVTVDSVAADDSVRVSVGADAATVRGLLRGGGARRLVLRATSGADTARVVASWMVRSLLDSVVAPAARVVFGDTVRGPLRLVAAPLRGATVTLRRDALVLPAGATIDSAGTLTVIGSRLGTDTLRLPLVLARPDGYRREVAWPLTLVVERLVLDAAVVRGGYLGTGAPLSPRAQAFLDAQGNRNGRVDLGDLRAWVIAEGFVPRGASPAEVMPALDAAAAVVRSPSSTPAPPR